MPQNPERVLLTRRHWDAYMLLLFLGTVLIGVIRAYQTSQLVFLFSPLVVLPLWLLLRFRTPRGGLQATSLRSTPGLALMLWFSAAALVSMALLFAIDIYLFGHDFYAPLEAYHVALFAPPFLILFVGGAWADRIRKAQRDGS